MNENEMVDFEFICSLIAFRNSKYKHCLVILLAENIDEANGIALRLGRETFPYKDGWSNHLQAVVELKELRSELPYSKIKS